MIKKLDPMIEDCDTCEAPTGTKCTRTEGFCDERWRRAAETRECLEEDRLERQRDVMADMKCRMGGPV